MAPFSTIIVIPTYNEKNNLRALIEKIFNLDITDLKIIVVDDNSPDATGVLARELADRHPMEVISRAQKAGLGTAYAEAFRKILAAESNQPDYIIQMDADLSHDPAVIPRMIAAANNADAVIGSRYVKGGHIENWNLTRRILSRFANTYARFVLDLPYRDITSGFRLYRKNVIQKILRENPSSIGYAFQIEMTYLAHRNGFKISEIPITFTERKLGKSKLDWKIIFESFIKVIEWRFKR